MDSIKYAENVTKGYLDTALGNPYIMAVLKITLALYAAQLSPRVPNLISNLFQNTFVKLIAVALIAYLANIDFQLSIILAIVFVIGSNLTSGRGLLESYMNQGPYFADSSKYNNLLGSPAVVGNATLLDARTDNFPGCETIKLADLLDIFDGDHTKMQVTLQSAFRELMQKFPDGTDAKNKLMKIARAVGLPYNVELNDENASLIATLLLQHGFIISESCQAPH